MSGGPIHGIITGRTVLPIVECYKFLIVYIAPGYDGTQSRENSRRSKTPSSSPLGEEFRIDPTSVP